MEKLKVYVGCGLTHVPQSYKEYITSFKDELRKIEWVEIMDFAGAQLDQELDEVHAHRVYKRDIHECVGASKAIIGDLTHPSFGLGWELGTSVEKHRIRTFMCVPKGVKVSRLPFGASFYADNRHATFHLYETSIFELIPYFIEELKSLHSTLQLSDVLDS